METPRPSYLWRISFPSMGGMAVSSQTLPAPPRKQTLTPRWCQALALRRRGSEMLQASYSRTIGIIACHYRAVKKIGRKASHISGGTALSVPVQGLDLSQQVR